MSSSSTKGIRKDKIKFLEDYYKDEMNKLRDFYIEKISGLNSRIESQSEGNEELEELKSTIESKDKEIEKLNSTKQSCFASLLFQTFFQLRKV